MITSRRSFLKGSAAILAGATVIPGSLFAFSKAKAKLGIQLWTVRDDMKKDPESTLKQLVKIGYKNIEHAGYEDRKFYGYTANEFKKILDDLGLNMFSGHVDMGIKDWDPVKKEFTDQWKYTVEDAVTAGQQYLITPALSDRAQKNEEELMRLLDIFNKCGAFCKKQGLKFGYHNDFSFDVLLNHERLYDIILKNTDPRLVTQELDIGNMYGELQNEKRKITDLLKAYPHRFPLLHVKDEFKIKSKGEMNNGYESTVLGKGEVPIKSIIDNAIAQNDIQYFIIEQESYQGISSLQCAGENYIKMKKWGL